MGIDLKELAETYLRSRHQRDQDFWSWEEVNATVRSGDLDRAYDITLLLLKTATTDDELGYVAAGPLEDLVDSYGNRALDRLEQACEGDLR